MIEPSEKQKLIIATFLELAQEVQDPQKINLSMIADRAGITRQGIYAKHFRDMEDLRNEIHLLIDRECMEKIEEFLESGRHDMVDYFVSEILPILYDKRDWLNVLYRTDLGGQWFVFLQTRYAPMLETYLSRSGKTLQVSPKFSSHFVVGLVATIIACWLTMENPMQPVAFKEKFLHLLSVPTIDWLNGRQIVQK